MFLSQLILNLRDRGVRRDLGNPYEMHRTLLRAFPNADAGGPGRVLFRLEVERHARPLVLVQSTRQPHWPALPSNYTLEHSLTSMCEVVFSPGQCLRFRLRANPCRRISAKCDDRLAGKRVALLGEEPRAAWLLRKAQEGGFQVSNHDFQIIPEGTLWARKGHQLLSLQSVRFEGILRVCEPERFRQTLFAGIGPAKGLGFGLLSVARPED